MENPVDAAAYSQQREDEYGATKCSARSWCRRRHGGDWARPREGPGKDGLGFDQANVTSSRPLGRVLRRKFHVLPFAQQFEHSATHCAAVKKMLNATLIADESESFIDEQACNGPIRHGRNPPMRSARNKIPGALSTAGLRTMVTTVAVTRTLQSKSSASVGSPGGEVKRRQNSLRLC